MNTISTRDKKLFPILAVAIGIAVALTIAELMLRAFGIGYGSAPVESHPVLHHVHPANYTFLAYSSGAEYEPFTVTYDERGLRTHHVPRVSTRGSARYRVAFIGDSFVEATQVSDRDSFIGRLMESSGESTEVLNCGVTSYSPIFYLLQWREIVARWQPTHVFVLLFGNDIRGDEEMARDARFSADNEVLAIPGPGDDWFVRVARRSYLIRLLRMSQIKIAWYLDNRGGAHHTDGHVIEEHEPVSARTGAYLRKLHAEVRSAGSEFVVMAVPSKGRLRFPDLADRPEFADYVRDWVHQNGITYLDLAPAFRQAASEGKKLFFDEDIHFNPAGHAVVANVIRAAYPQLFSAHELNESK
jgi:hypothetical protein